MIAQQNAQIATQLPTVLHAKMATSFMNQAVSAIQVFVKQMGIMFLGKYAHLVSLLVLLAQVHPPIVYPAYQATYFTKINVLHNALMQHTG